MRLQSQKVVKYYIIHSFSKMILKLEMIELLSIIVQVTLGLQVFQENVIVNSSELIVLPLTPGTFNWELDPELRNQIRYSARISQSPDLPGWLHYTYDGSTSIGHLYGVPPRHLPSMDIDVIARNKNQTYDVSKLVISLTIISQLEQNFVVEFKIDNMDAKDFCNLKERNRLVNIFSNFLDWRRENGDPVTSIYLASASSFGESRRSFEAEGVIIHLGSDKNFSTELYKLQSEVSPLWKLRPCPRDLKRTSMERYFRSQGILVDWCSFKLTFKSPSKYVFANSAEVDEKDIGEDATHMTEDTNDIFQFKTTIPERSYGWGILLATIVPGVIGSFIAILLIGILWNDDDESSPVNGDTLFFEAAFRILAILCSFKTKTQDQDEVEIMKNPSLSEGNYQQYNAPENEGDYFLLTGDEARPDPLESQRERSTTPMPPQYATHPNGSPALTYAV